MASDVQPRTSIDTLRERLDDPQVAAALNNLLDHADLLAILLVGLDGFVSRSETIGQAVAEGIADIREVAGGTEALDGLDPAQLFSSLVALSGTLPTLSTALSQAVEDGVIDEVLNSGIASPEMVRQVTRLGRGLVRGAEIAEANPPEVKGAFSMVKLLKDPDIQRTINYFAAVARAIGQELATDNRPARGN